MPSRPSATKKSNFVDRILSPSGIVALLVIMIIVSGGIYLYPRRTTFIKNIANFGKVKPTVKPTPTPYPLPQGSQTYPFGYGSDIQGPKPSEVTINPYDPKKGEKQTFTVKIKHDKPITYAAIILETDNKVKTYPLTRTQGTDTEGSIWETTITTDDTHFYVYNVGLDFQSGTEKTTIMPKLTLRAY